MAIILHDKPHNCQTMHPATLQKLLRNDKEPKGLNQLLNSPATTTGTNQIHRHSTLKLTRPSGYMFLMPEDTPRGSGGRSNNCISYNKKIIAIVVKGTEKYISIKSVQQEVVPRPQLHVLRRRVKLHFYYKKEEGKKKKCESYEVEIKTN